MSGGLEPADLGLAKTFAEGNTEVPPSLVPLFPLPSFAQQHRPISAACIPARNAPVASKKESRLA